MKKRRPLHEEAPIYAAGADNHYSKAGGEWHASSQDRSQNGTAELTFYQWKEMRWNEGGGGEAAESAGRGEPEAGAVGRGPES